MSLAKQRLLEELEWQEIDECLCDAFYHLSGKQASGFAPVARQYVAALILDELVYRQDTIYSHHQADAACKVLGVSWPLAETCYWDF